MRISKTIMRKARNVYVSNKKTYDQILNSRNLTLNSKYLSDGTQVSNYDENSNNVQDSKSILQRIANNTEPIKNLSNSSNFSQPSNMNQDSSQQQVSPNYSGAPIQVVNQDGSTPTSPISIVAKNYINTDNLDDDEVEEKKNVSLAKLPDNLLKSSTTDWEPINYRGVDDSYDLYGASKVEIKYDENHQKILYKIIEPELTDLEKDQLEELKRAFIYVFEKFSPEFIDVSGKQLIIDGTKELAKKYRIKISEESFEKITYYLIRDFLGLEILEPIMHDHFIEDVSCDGLNVPIFVNHLKYGPLEVNRKYQDPIKLNSFIVKLAQKSNQEISLSKPILQGALPDGSRIEAIYGKEVSEKGSSFTIRKFREEPFTPIHLIEFGTMPPFLLAYLWLAVENKQSLLVSGGTATGKTTILNALSLFAPPTSKIVSIEDTPEINLPHEHWLPMVARGGEDNSAVTMFDLLKASLRERPDYIIVGEIRGEEAAILFQGMATGHAGMGTVHAEKFTDLVNRMVIDPINLPPQLLTELNIAIFQKQVKIKNNVVRRTYSVVEVIDYNSKKDKFTTNEFMHFDAKNDEFVFEQTSAIISHLIEIRGGNEDSLWTEIEKRRRILDYMHKHKVLEFNDVANIIRAYYKDPKGIFEYIENYINEVDPKSSRG